MEGTYDIPNNNPHFFVTTEPKSDGALAEMHITSYIFIIIKHIQVSSQFRKFLMLKVRLSFFGTICTSIAAPQNKRIMVGEKNVYFECIMAYQVHNHYCING